MAEYKTTIVWERGTQLFIDNRYSRSHKWKFDEGIEVEASSSPNIVPLPYSNAVAIDPEEAFVASLSSCHMLWFLSIAAKSNLCVDSYFDEAWGTMGKDNSGRLFIAHVLLQPKTLFSGNRLPTENELILMHEEAHKECFIANSVKTNVQYKSIYIGSKEK
jgi:organic hydroperoxide reductase OsmC/OhrA